MTPIVDPLSEWMKLPLQERKARALRYKRVPRTKVEKERIYTLAQKQLRRERKIVKKYGLTKEQWNLLFSEQGHCCGICSRPDSGSKYGWATDHCHLTGKVRGILCHGCNLALGAFRDSVSALKSAIRYLRSSQC
jgi:hypothetical protein